MLTRATINLAQLGTSCSSFGTPINQKSKCYLNSVIAYECTLMQFNQDSTMRGCLGLKIPTHILILQRSKHLSNVFEQWQEILTRRHLYPASMRLSHRIKEYAGAFRGVSFRCVRCPHIATATSINANATPHQRTQHDH